MEQGFVDRLKKLIDEQGKEALIDLRKCKPLLADYTRNEYKRESQWLVQAVEAGVAKAVAGADELELCKKAQIRELVLLYMTNIFDVLVTNLRRNYPYV